MTYVPYVPNAPAWDSSTNISAVRLNHLQEQYQDIEDFLNSHNHNDIYYTQVEMDSFFWSGLTDGAGSTLDADKLEGSEGADISSGIDNGVIGFWYGTLADFTGKLLTGYPNWHIADGTDGTIDLTDLFPIGASAPGSGYQPGDAVGSKTFALAGTAIISSHVLTIDEIMHTHELDEGGPIPSKVQHGGVGTSSLCSDNPGNLGQDASITSTTGGGGGHVHGTDFAGTTYDLLPPFLSLIAIQYTG